MLRILIISSPPTNSRQTDSMAVASFFISILSMCTGSGEIISRMGFWYLGLSKFL